MSFFGFGSYRPVLPIVATRERRVVPSWCMLFCLTEASEVAPAPLEPTRPGWVESRDKPSSSSNENSHDGLVLTMSSYNIH